MLPPRLNAVTLVTDDVLERRRFYESLGWSSPSEPRDDFVMFRHGGAAFSIWTSGEAREEIAEPLRRSGFEFPGFTLAVAVEREELVDEGLEAARSAGAAVVAEPVKRPFGGRSGYFADPAGVPWEVVWIPGTSIDENGGLRFETQ
jgi:catechol 2,3-dioxygenase-like lactoylglutathione lyase family enzyme